MKRYEHMSAGLLGGLATLALAAVSHAQGANGNGSDQELGEVVVTGSRVIANGNDSPNPVTVVTVEELQASRPTTVFEALEELPVFSAGRGGALGGNTGQGSNNNSIASLNLRALGSLRGLILFDGHRVPPQNADGNVDINQIPQLLLQRVDVQTGGASAVYGSDALTGVVNFITDRRFNGLKVNAQAGISDYRDDRSNELSVAAGRDLFSGRGHIEGSAQSHYDGGLYRDQRPYVQAPGAYTWAMGGNGTAATPYFLTQNIHDSSQTSGGKITGPANNPLLNQNFTANGVLSPFVNGITAGLTGNNQIGGQGGLTNNKTTLKVPVDNIQLFGRFDFDVTDNLHYFAASGYNIEHQFSTLANFRSNGASALTNTTAGFVMSVDNAFLPASYSSTMKTAGLTTFNVGKIWDSAYYLPNTYDYHIHNFYLNTGFEGKFGEGWRWETSATRSQAVQANTANRTISTGRLLASLDAVTNSAGQVVCQVSTTANAGLYPGCVPLNIFGPTATSAEAWNYVLQPTRYISTTDLTALEGSVSGSLFNTWAGPVNSALSAEWRKLKYLFLSYGEPANNGALDCAGLRFNCGSPSATSIGTAQTYSNGSAGSALQQPVTQTVKEIAFESDIPLLKDVRLAKDVDLLLAYRNAQYSSFGTPDKSIAQGTVKFNANTWKVGLDWHFNDAFTVRGTRSRDFRAPNLGDLYLPGRTQGYNLAQDLLTGATQVSTQQAVSGNPQLHPEVGHTTTVGFVIKPSDKFSVSVDAYDIAIVDAITNVDGSSNVYQAACYASGGTSPFCTLQIRALGSYTNASAANKATLWFTSAPVNVGYIHTQGVDVENNLRLRVQDHPVSLRALVTYQPHIWTQQYATATADSGGVSSARVRASMSVHYGFNDNLTMDWTTRYRSRLQNVDSRTVQTNGQPVIVLDGSLNVASAMYSNLTFTYHVPQFTRGKLDTYLNVTNLFNHIPPVYVPTGGGSLFGQVAGGGGLGFYPADDGIGRYFNLGMRLRL